MICTPPPPFLHISEFLDFYFFFIFVNLKWELNLKLSTGIQTSNIFATFKVFLRL